MDRLILIMYMHKDPKWICTESKGMSCHVTIMAMAAPHCAYTKLKITAVIGRLTCTGRSGNKVSNRTP